MNLNKVFLIGRLTQDPQVRTTPSGQMVCSFGLATNRIWTNQQTNERQEKTDYHNIVLWQRLAEIASQYLTKGSLVFIEGRIQTRSWQDQEGNKRTRTEIVAENIQLGPKNLQSGTQIAISETKETPTEEIPVIEEESPPENPAPTQTNTQEKNIKEEENEEEIDVKDIPF